MIGWEYWRWRRKPWSDHLLKMPTLHGLWLVGRTPPGWSSPQPVVEVRLPLWNPELANRSILSVPSFLLSWLLYYLQIFHNKLIVSVVNWLILDSNSNEEARIPLGVYGTQGLYLLVLTRVSGRSFQTYVSSNTLVTDNQIEWASSWRLKRLLSLSKASTGKEKSLWSEQNYFLYPLQRHFVIRYCKESQ